MAAAVISKKVIARPCIDLLDLFQQRHQAFSEISLPAMRMRS
jgi:hypothetical protein